QIKRRIMALDFTLNHPEGAFLTSEKERLAFFERAGIPPQQLPQRSFRTRTGVETTTRYFIYKDPLFTTGRLTYDMLAAATVAFVDEGLVTLSRSERFLREHQPIFQHLNASGVIYVEG